MTQCTGTTARGERCRLEARPGRKRCHHHARGLANGGATTGAKRKGKGKAKKQAKTKGTVQGTRHRGGDAHEVELSDVVVPIANKIQSLFDLKVGHYTNRANGLPDVLPTVHKLQRRGELHRGPDHLMTVSAADIGRITVAAYGAYVESMRRSDAVKAFFATNADVSLASLDGSDKRRIQQFAESVFAHGKKIPPYREQGPGPFAWANTFAGASRPAPEPQSPSLLDQLATGRVDTRDVRSAKRQKRFGGYNVVNTSPLR